MGKPRLKLHIISHIRWEREGLRTFQESRLDLVRVLDRLLTPFGARPQLNSLILGGQSILIEDYLEVRPQYRAVVGELAENDQLCIGPWYVLPSEFLVSPEALIRNLLQGMQITLSLGARCVVGYIRGAVTHVGQLPQILRGFGLESVAVAHSSQPGIPPIEEWWLAPDASSLLLINLYEEQADSLAQLADTNSFAAALTQIKNRLKDRSTSRAFAVLYDGQTQELLCKIADLIERIEGQVRGTDVIHGDLPSYLSEVTEAGKDLPSFAGERLAAEPLAGALSTHIWIKQYNHDVQTLLERWAEPFGAWASMLGGEGGAAERSENGFVKPGDLLAHAWQIMLPNHAHSSISGQVVDQVSREMQVRFDQAAQIGTAIIDQSLSKLCEQVDTSELPGEEQGSFAIVFNGTGQSRTDIVRIGMPSRPEDDLYQVLDTTGTPLPSENSGPADESEGSTRVNPSRCVSFVARDVPAYGYRTYIIRPQASDVPETEFDDIPTIENQYLGVSVNPADGTLALFDKHTGRTFEQLNRYVDGGDCGDATAYRAPRQDTLIDIATNTPLHMERRVSAVQQELSYLQIFRLPQQLTPQRDARLPLTAQFVPISIVTTLRLASDVPRLDIEVHVSNNALDHRLRVHFPTGIQASDALFDGHFEVVRRPVPGDYPQRDFVTIMGTDTGLTVANQGLPEVAVLAGREGAEIALTLLRSVGWLRLGSFDDPQAEYGQPRQTPDAQCRGNYRFAYSLIPHGQDPLGAWQQAWAFQAPMRGHLTPAHRGTLPVSHGLAIVDNPAFVLSAVKAAENGDGLIVRGYSISGDTEQVALKLGVQASHVELVRIDETPTGKTIKPDARGRYKFKVRPAEIVTLHIAAANPQEG